MRSVSRTVLFTVCLSLLWGAAKAASGPVTLNVDVPAGQWKGVRLRYLPKGTLVAVEVESSGDVIVAFVDSTHYQRFPDIPRPLFLGQVDKRLSFSISIPATDHYFLVFDNRSGRRTRAVKATIGATRAGATSIEAADKILHQFERQLHQLFVFDSFPVRVERCGKPKAFADTAGIVLCAEYIRYLYDAVGERQKVVDTLSFTIFYQVGHILLAQWKHSSSDKQKIVGEFAAVLLVMLNKKERIRAMAEYFVANPSASRMLAKLFPKDYHPLSVGRARDIVRWLKDPHLVRKWQKTFIPHMQTALLKKLQQKPTEWTDLDLVNKELASRRGVVPKNAKGLDL